MTNKFREFQTEGGSKRPGWRGPVRGCLASSFLPSTARDFQLEPLHAWPREGWSIFWLSIKLSLVCGFHFASLQLSVLLTAWL